MPKKKPVLIDLFSGVGGISLGFKKAGFKPLLGVEFDPQIAASFEKNLKVECCNTDIKDIEGKHILEKLGMKASDIDVVAGGPPCQGFSMANRKRILDDPRNRLFVHFIEIVRDISPQAVLVENVPGLKSDLVYNEIIEEFDKLGYTTVSQILNTADFGVPQLRERLFLICTKQGIQFTFPEGTHCSADQLPYYEACVNQLSLLESISPEPKQVHTTVRDAISDLPRIDRGDKCDEYYLDPQTDYQKERRGKQTILHNHEATPHDDEAYRRIKLIEPGQNWRNLPDHLKTKSVHSGAYGRLEFDKASPTITTRTDTPTTGRVVHPVDHRTISIREAARIQSFDDSVVFYGTKTSKGKQVGNAVPPLLAYAIGNAIRNQLL